MSGTHRGYGRTPAARLPALADAGPPHAHSDQGWVAALAGRSAHDLETWTQKAEPLPAMTQVQPHGWIIRVIRRAEQALLTHVTQQQVMKPRADSPAAVVRQDGEFHELEVAPDPAGGDVSREHVTHQIRPVLSALADVTPGETRRGGSVRGDGESVTSSGGMPVEQVTPPSLTVVEVAENRLVARPDAIRKSLGRRRSVQPYVDA